MLREAIALVKKLAIFSQRGCGQSKLTMDININFYPTGKRFIALLSKFI